MGDGRRTDTTLRINIELVKDIVQDGDGVNIGRIQKLDAQSLLDLKTTI